MMDRLFRPATYIIFGAVLAGGCSTWRCRGFVDARDVPVESGRDNYSLESIEFMHLAGEDTDIQENNPRLFWLSQQDALVDTSYLWDISREAGMTNSTGSFVPVNVKIVPISETKVGWASIFWPLSCTLGVMPAHFSEQVSFDVIVQFGNAKKVAYATVGVVKTDLQRGLSRYDMDSPPQAPGAVVEFRDEGTIGTGSGIRPARLRSVFVSTVVAALNRAVALREKSKCEQGPQPATEFGPIVFPKADAVERTNTQGYGGESTYAPPPPPPPPPPPTVDTSAVLRNAWNSPIGEEERKLKVMVESGFMSRQDWELKILEIRKNGKGEVK